MPLRVRLTGGLGHAFFAATAWEMPEAVYNASGALGRLLVPDGEKVLLTSTILTASIYQSCHPERNLHGRQLKRCAAGSLLHCSWPERKATNALRCEQPATPKGNYCLRSWTGDPGNSTLPRALEVGKGSFENLSGARAFGCFCTYSETKFRMPALRGLTLPVNGLRRQAAQARAMTMVRMKWRGLATHAVAGPFDRRVRPHSASCAARAEGASTNLNVVCITGLRLNTRR
jgi:hypothetical protein